MLSNASPHLGVALPSHFFFPRCFSLVSLVVDCCDLVLPLTRNGSQRPDDQIWETFVPGPNAMP